MLSASGVGTKLIVEVVDDAQLDTIRDIIAVAGAGIRHRLHLTIGDPATEIVHLARETRCELLVLGTRGLGAAHHALIGSVALKAAAHAPVPVALVR